MSNKSKKLLAWVLVLGWMIFIFCMSNQPADISNEQSDFVLNLIRATGIDINGSYVDIAITIIRKGAHFTEYMILSILYINLLRYYMNIKDALVFSVILSFLYASTDEFHQLFIEGRAGRFTDVLIDTSGAITGSILVWIGSCVLKGKRVKV